MRPQNLLFIAFSMLLGAAARAAESTLSNPTDRPYSHALVRLKTPVPAEAFLVKLGGTEIPYQIEELAGQKWIWVAAEFAAGESKTFTVLPGNPGKTPPRVTVRRDGNVYLLDNGTTAIKVPAEMGAELSGPILSIRLPNGSWVGRSVWKTALKPTRFSATVIGDGTVFGKIRLRYEFAGPAGEAVPFAEVDVKLGPDWRHAEIAERHEMPAGDYWEFAAADGWSPRDGRSVPFSAGPGSGSILSAPVPERSLQPGKLPFQRPDLFINLVPRWNQHFKDGWFFAVTDGKSAVGVMPVLAGQWVWPHDNSLEIIVNETGAYAGVRCRTRHGTRLWWLLAGESESVAGRANINYFHQYAFENLDKINHDFILGWEGKSGGVVPDQSVRRRASQSDGYHAPVAQGAAPASWARRQSVHAVSSPGLFSSGHIRHVLELLVTGESEFLHRLHSRAGAPDDAIEDASAIRGAAAGGGNAGA